MKKIVLKNSYIHVKDGERVSYGGNQSRFLQKRLAWYGCGLVSIGDIILYLTRYGAMPVWSVSEKIIHEPVIGQAEYLKYLEELGKRFFYVSYLARGIVGPALAVGFNALSLIHKSPYRARWGVPASKIHSAITLMLQKDIPVLFSAGMHFPQFWKKEGIKLYQKVSEQNGDLSELVCCTSTCKHYMTITGILSDERQGELLRVSSWGTEYYIKWEEYETFVRHKSNALFSNILFITDKKGGKHR